MMGIGSKVSAIVMYDDSAWEKGYNQGYKEGYADGQEFRFEEGVREAIGRMRQKVQSWENELEELM